MKTPSCALQLAASVSFDLRMWSIYPACQRTSDVQLQGTEWRFAAPGVRCFVLFFL